MFRILPQQMRDATVAIAIYISICAVISVVAAAMMPDYTGQDISAELAGRGVAD